jgi:hypothetical protein
MASFGFIKNFIFTASFLMRGLKGMLVFHGQINHEFVTTVDRRLVLPQIQIRTDRVVQISLLPGGALACRRARH